MTEADIARKVLDVAAQRHVQAVRAALSVGISAEELDCEILSFMLAAHQLVTLSVVTGTKQ